MCGIAGFLRSDSLPGAWSTRETLERMTDLLAHRGPDDRGVWLDHGAGVGLGHRRLAIQDLSREGAQPMVSASGRFRVVFNGEIYNFQALQRELQARGCRFRGHSDTEVLLAAVETWGLQRALERFIGMFAFALWDGEASRLFLVRDRLGVKPLYYGRVAGGWVFASELKSFKAIAGFAPRVDRQALARYMGLGYVPAPWTIYRDVCKVAAGTILTLRPEPQATAYWTPCAMVEEGRGRWDEGAGPERLRETLEDAVALRLVSDAPVGAFLSGGIDSSLVVALMCRRASGPVRTFAIGFHEQQFNEAHHARLVADHLHTDHTEWMITATDALQMIPELPRIYDEPFADPSQIPTCLVSRLARRHVTVALSGDGGDEFFAGYNRYRRLRQVWRLVAWLPDGVRQRLGNGLRHLLTMGGGPYNGWGVRLDKGAAALAATTPEEFYHALFANWLRATAVVQGVGEGMAPSPPPHCLDDFLSRILYRDMVGYLPDDILVKVDRASMDVGLEVRGPLLDHRVAALAWSMPHHLKMGGGIGKLPLRRMVYELLPRALVDRPKQGFAVPIAQWLRGPLAEWAGDLLAGERLQRQGYFDPLPIQRVWREHRQGGRDWSLALWTVLMFQAWLEGDL